MTGDLYENETTASEKVIGWRDAFGRLLPFLYIHKKGLAFCLALLTISTGLSLWWPVLLKDALDIDIKNSDFQGLLATVLTIAGIQAVTVVVQYIQRVKLEIIGQNIMVEIKTKIFHHILSLDVSFFDKNPVGRLLSRVESDTEALRLMFTNTVVLLIGDVLLITGIFTIMFYHSWRLASILILNLPIILILVLIFERKTTPRFYEVRRKMAEVTATLTEFLHGMSIIQIFHRGEYAKKRFNHMNRLKFIDDRYVNVAVVLFFNTVFFFQYVMIALVLFFGMYWIGTGKITVGTISLFIVLIWRSFDPIWRTSEQLSNIQKAVAGAKRIFNLLEEKSVIPDPEQPAEFGAFSKSIKFENVWFSYGNDESWVLKDVSFEIPKGSRTALVGVTGGGKTTVITLLLRMYDPQKGRILIDGVDIREIPKAELRKLFALVLQDIFLFPGNVASNIALESTEISEERIKSAALTVEADRFIGRLPAAYKTEVSEKGSNFSRGERQLLSFARALVVDPEVLLLDEATSSVDPETERTIQSSLKKLMEGRTSIIIAHRLSTILDVDQILVIRRGEVIERGNHTDLILQNGYYSKLFHLQFKNKNGVAANVG